MNKYGFASGLAAELESYIGYKEASGFNKNSFIKRLRQFDRFCVERSIDSIRFTKEDAVAWAEKRTFHAQQCILGNMCQLTDNMISRKVKRKMQK